MTKKDYIIIVSTIVNTFPESQLDEEQHYKTLILLAKNFANRLALDNPRFDRQRFLDACTIPNL